MFPNSQRINRGTHQIEEIVAACKARGVTDIVILHETRGVPDGVIVSHLPFGPTAYFGLANVVMRHDIENHGTVSEQYPHLVFHDFTTALGERVTNILKNLFPVPKDESKRVMTFANIDDYISFRHHVYEKRGKEVKLKEVGPRFEMRLYQIKLGTVDQKDVENEVRERVCSHKSLCMHRVLTLALVSSLNSSGLFAPSCVQPRCASCCKQLASAREIDRELPNNFEPLSCLERPTYGRTRNIHCLPSSMRA